MAFLLDTMAISESTKEIRNTGFVRWFSQHSNDEMFVPSPAIGEIEVGIALLDAKDKRRKQLEVWLERLIAEFEDRTLSFDIHAARLWGRAVGLARRNGRTLPVVDSQIASIAGVHGLTVVTRNVGHFDVKPFDVVKAVNPWD